MKTDGCARGPGYRIFRGTRWGEIILMVLLFTFLFPQSPYPYWAWDRNYPETEQTDSGLAPVLGPGAPGEAVPEGRQPGPDQGTDSTSKNRHPPKPAPDKKPDQDQKPETTGGEEKEQPGKKEQPGEKKQPVEKEQPGDKQETAGNQDLQDQTSSETVFRGNPKAGKLVALTFDDGPYARWTAEYLKVLETYRVPGTFFLVGQRVERYPEIVRKIGAQGYEMGSHSYRHAKLTLEKPEVVHEDFRKTVAAFQAAGQEVKLFRPPYGAYNATVIETAENFGQQAVCWNVDPQDWDTEDADQVVHRVLSHVADGSIVLLHEGRKSTLAALPQIIAGLQQKGYELVTVSRLLSESGSL